VPFDDQTELTEAVLWAKGRGLIAGESGLLLWDLTDVNPRKIHIVVPPGYGPRRAGGELYEIHHVLVEAANRDEVHGLPVVSVAFAIRQPIDWGVAGDMIEQTVRRAQAREHIRTQTAARLLVRLYDRALPDRRHGDGASTGDKGRRSHGGAMASRLRRRANRWRSRRGSRRTSQGGHAWPMTRHALGPQELRIGELLGRVGDQPIPNYSARLRSTTRCSLGLDSGVSWYLWRATW